MKNSKISSVNRTVLDSKQVLLSARPPWHAVLFMAVSAGVLFRCLPSLEQLDEIAIVDTFTKRTFPDLVSLRMLAYIRAAIAMIVWATTVYNLVSPGWEQMTPYMKRSKLKMVPNQLTGVRTLYPFTSWSWLILGASFSLSSYISWTAESAGSVSPLILRAAVIAWEIAAPCTLLVASTIRYVMWPAVLKRGGPHSLNSVRNMLMHNFNVAVALTETCLLSGMPVRWSEAAVAPLWGCIYVIFSWNMVFAWNERRHGPQFIYFFLDTTLPGFFCSQVLVALMIVLLMFYAALCFSNDLLSQLDGGVFAHLSYICILSGMVMRFRD